MGGFAVDLDELIRLGGLMRRALEQLEQTENRIGAELSILAQTGFGEQLTGGIEQSRMELREAIQDLERLIAATASAAALYDRAENENRQLVAALPSGLFGRWAGGGPSGSSATHIIYSSRINPEIAHEGWLLEMAVQDVQDADGD